MVAYVPNPRRPATEAFGPCTMGASSRCGIERGPETDNIGFPPAQSLCNGLGIQLAII